MPSFFVHGLPATAGSKRAFPIRRKDGSLGVAVSPDNVKSRPWMSMIAEAARPYFAGPIVAGKPIALRMSFILPRPKSHLKPNGELRRWAPHYPAVRPDCSKLVRCAEDALKGVAWSDDSQVVRLTVDKTYGETPGVMICVESI